MHEFFPDAHGVECVPRLERQLLTLQNFFRLSIPHLDVDKNRIPEDPDNLVLKVDLPFQNQPLMLLEAGGINCSNRCLDSHAYLSVCNSSATL